MTVFAFVFASCSSPGPLPAEYAAVLPPEVPVAPAVREEVAAHVTASARALEAGDLGGARDEAQAAVDLDPRSVAARLAMARAWMATAQQDSPPSLEPWQRAEGELLLAAKLAPEDPDVALQRARFLEADGHLTAAVDVLEQALTSRPDDADLLAAAARLRYDLAEERAALPWLQRLTALRPNDADARYRLAQVRLQLARTGANERGDAAARRAAFEGAAAAFADYRALAPEDAAAAMGEGFAWLQAWRAQPSAGGSPLEAAIDAFRRAEQLDRTSPEPSFDVGVALEAAGDPEAARGAFERALRRDPEHLPSVLDLAANLRDAGRSDEARSFYERALRLPLAPDERRAIEAWLEEAPEPAAVTRP